MNYRQIYAIKKKRKEQIKELCPEIDETSGIYIFLRWKKEEKKWCVYIGQAKNLLERCANHLDGYKTKNPSHIDKSLKTHGIRTKENPEGWLLNVVAKCSIDELDTMEKDFIEYYRKKGNTKLYNITIGGQNEGKVDFQERSQEKLKRYKHGKEQGEKKVLEKVKTYFDKYLDYVIKGKPNKIKERKLKEFEDFLKNI